VLDQRLVEELTRLIGTRLAKEAKHVLQEEYVCLAVACFSIFCAGEDVTICFWVSGGNINKHSCSVAIVQCNNVVVRCSRQLIGPADRVSSHWDPYIVISLKAVAYSSYCNMVEWFWWDWSLSQRPTGFLQCFYAVGWVIWPVKIVPEMTYKVSSGTLSLHSLQLFAFVCSSTV